MIFTDECMPMYVHIDIMMRYFHMCGKNKALKLMYICLTMQMIIWYKQGRTQGVSIGVKPLEQGRP